MDGRADQFSLAVIAFEMLTGEKPFTGEQLTTVVYKIVAEEPSPVARLNATLEAADRGGAAQGAGEEAGSCATAPARRWWTRSKARARRPRDGRACRAGAA